ncbi:hypothetical protein L596_021456 [Steinernema carpocapsae]|uniref:Uncharacterized protein n=1 Tax=Steinernema carpocapsae TaxID=34508 RepID=A0A4V5ZZZ3_STECR|nr:hypothetical protein L596_021456 [Steinernema carpocapsae]
MDSSPYAFCDDVLTMFRFEKGKSRLMSSTLPPLWADACDRHLENRVNQWIKIAFVPPNQWFYATSFRETPPLNEIFCQNQRFVQFHNIWIGPMQCYASPKMISEDDLFGKLIPFLGMQMTESCTVFFQANDVCCNVKNELTKYVGNKSFNSCPIGLYQRSPYDIVTVPIVNHTSLPICDFET